MKPRSVPWTIFRAYDIRGRADGDDAQLTPALVYAIARTYGNLLQETWNTSQTVIGGDQRRTTPSLKQAAGEGLADAGIALVDLGRAPSPLIYWASAELSRSQPCGGIAITASHNPAQDNGVKLLEPGGMPVLPDVIREIGRRIELGDIGAGSERGKRRSWDPIPQYITSLARTYALARPLRVAIDPGNGVAALTAARALRACGAEVVAINDDPDEPNPPHVADPQHAEHMQQLARFVLEAKADLGFAFDGDGDRLGLVDRAGCRVTPDTVLALLASDWLESHPQADVHIDVKTSQAVIDVIQQQGGRAVFGPVGHSLGKHAMLRNGIAFGGEASTHYFHRIDDPAHISDDAVRTACRIAQIASRSPLADQIEQIPAYETSPELKIACADERKFGTVSQITAYARERWPVSEIDGARIDLSSIAEGAWAVIRASNTTPYLTVVIEARRRSDFDRVQTVVAGVLSLHGLDPGPLG